MKRLSFTAPTALLAALTFTAAPSIAQEKYHGGENRDSHAGQASGQQPQRAGGQAHERAQPRSEAPRAQAQAARPQAQAPQTATPRSETPRAQAGAAPRVETRQQAVPRPQAPQQVTPRADNRAYDGHQNQGQAVPRHETIAPRGNVYAPRYAPRYAPHYAPLYAPRVYFASPRYYASASYYRPYVYRPRFAIGFGIFVGYPVPYAYSYPSPVYVYGYGAPRTPVMITPGSSAYGGVALEITPNDAEVFVDGQYAGRVQEFDGYEQPLNLTPGRHSIEVQAQGYQPLVFDVDVQPGQVTPYRGDLRPY